MAMGRRRDRACTPGLWIPTNDLPTTGSHPFYRRLNHILDEHSFDGFVESQCARFYAAKLGRRSLQGRRAAKAVVLALLALVSNADSHCDPRPTTRGGTDTPRHRFELLPIIA
jgi:hypothetical protein